MDGLLPRSPAPRRHDAGQARRRGRPPLTSLSGRCFLGPVPDQREPKKAAPAQEKDRPVPPPYEPPTLVEQGTLTDLTATGTNIDPT